MVNLLLLLSLPALLVFSLYHLGVWLVPVRFRRPPFWCRVALASALAHLLLLAGLIGLAYGIGGAPQDLFALLWIWDPVASAALWGVIALAVPETSATLLPVAGLMYLGLGTLQWFAVGGALAAAFERLWEALRTPGDQLPNWF